jgi:hypothetical protein
MHGLLRSIRGRHAAASSLPFDRRLTMTEKQINFFFQRRMTMLEQRYQLYLALANDGKGGDITNGGAPLKTFVEWLAS